MAMLHRSQRNSKMHHNTPAGQLTSFILFYFKTNTATTEEIFRLFLSFSFGKKSCLCSLFKMQISFT